ncbi:HsdR family type I site-specific deoxyribonuclease [Puniceicoccaceae bacterium K14]|nr:HsdR family type I site-specific deoxyribonuclease [Puniceicoccaceae bacterium K14]
MTNIGKPERATQNRVIALFRDELDYDYLGNWEEREGNSNIEEELLTQWLAKQGHTPAQISQAIHLLHRRADKGGRDLYYVNKDVYHYLRYGVSVKVEAAGVTETVKLIDCKYPENNHFSIAEEVTLKGAHERRPDLVLYVNGIAIGVIELKSSRVTIGDGIRQLISNQQPEFNEWFFSTVQLVFAGSDTEGLQYGTTDTSEKYFLKWKEDEDDNEGYKLDKYLAKMCRKERIIELMHDFVLFDGGKKKVPRVHQYFGIKAAQAHAQRHEGGIIWHTQGSGKSIVMVLLAKWILENNSKARIVIVTDRDELDKQIEGVLKQSSVIPDTDKVRATSGQDLLKKLSKANPRLVCTLVHKFCPRGPKGELKFDDFIKELESSPSKTVGDVFVFVDECHRTQSGNLNKAMKAVMPNAVFIGFTGTPLLKKDKQTTMEVFGRYIHRYKFSEAVEDEVVLDLIYEARDIDQRLGSQDKIDAWFEAKTAGLNDWQKDELKKKWGTMQKVLSSKSRMSQVVTDIAFDFTTKPRLSHQRGNAILVAKSIYEACRYYTLFNTKEAGFKGKCAVITSYNPHASDVAKEDTGADTETAKQVIYDTYTKLLKDVSAAPGQSATKTYEDTAKQRFIKEPAQMKLLVVVDKLLTGFDAPPCTYLYIDKTMKDHGLFQAICRTNRLDGEDKDFGYIVDYMDLFTSVENAIAVYSAELDHGDEAGGDSSEVLLKDRLKKGRERLDAAIEQLALLCEPVEPPKAELDYIHYFCGNTEIVTDLAETEPQRAGLYKGTASLVRAYANIADEMTATGYSKADCTRITGHLKHYVWLRDTIRKAAVEELDTKAYEADMRHLIDNYINAEDPKKISNFEDVPLVDLIVKTGIADAIAEKLGNMKSKESVAETIENNVRSKIIKESLTNPAYYDKMSELLDEIIADRKRKAIEYEEYLKRIAALAKNVQSGHTENTPKVLKKSKALAAIYANLQPFSAQQVGEGKAPYSKDQLLELAQQIDLKVREVKQDGFRGHEGKERIIKGAILPLLNHNTAKVESLFDIIKQQAEY